MQIEFKKKPFCRERLHAKQANNAVTFYSPAGGTVCCIEF